jgi:4-hydroxybenzoate polyprenyltransferase
VPDQFLINAAQAAYDWIFDRTGILKGHIAQTFIITYLTLRLGLHPVSLFWLSIPFIMFLLIAHHWNVHQKQSHYVTINAQALVVSQSYFSLIFRMAILFLFFKFDEPFYWWSFSYGIVLLLFNYLMCVKVRDREPPESSFFEFNPTGA